MKQEPCAIINEIAGILRKKEMSADRRLASLIFQWEAALKSNPVTALCQRGLVHSNHAAYRLTNIRTTHQVDHIAEITGFLMSEYELCQQDSTHRERRKRLEDIIRLLLPLEEKGDPRILTMLCRAYLHRSLLFKPRSFGVPARKIEALRKVVSLTDHILSCQNPIHAQPEALKLWILAALELEKATERPNEKMNDYLELAAPNLTVSEFKDLVILVEHAERCLNRQYLPRIFDYRHQNESDCDISLLYARVYLFLQDENMAATHIQTALDHCPNAIADPFWHDIFKTLMRFYKKQFKSWQQLSLAVWEKIKNIEIEISSNIYLNWYWADKKKIYDLAFLAAPAEPEKCIIADSLKSRPAARYTVLESLKSERAINDFLESDYEARDRRYIKRISRVSENANLSAEIKKKQLIPPDKLPAPWIAVHFYLNEMKTTQEDTGAALIYDSEKKTWEHRLFKYKHLYRKFIEWQSIYISEKEKSQKQLKSLCLEIGCTMPFLFDKTIFPDNRPVLWIPFGFLHRLPLHAAIQEETNAIFLKTHVSRYLPAWSMADETIHSKASSRFFLKKFEEYNFNQLQSLKWDKIINPAKSSAGMY